MNISACPACGSPRVREFKARVRPHEADRGGTVYEYGCNDCGLFEEACDDRLEVGRLKARWRAHAPLDTGPGEEP